MKLQNPKETATILRRLPRSASHAMGMPAVTYTKAKLKPLSNPNCASLSPRSALIGSCRMTKICRSIKLKVYTKVSMTSTVQR